jgi:hypothetical protein
MGSRGNSLRSNNHDFFVHFLYCTIGSVTCERPKHTGSTVDRRNKRWLDVIVFDLVFDLVFDFVFDFVFEFAFDFDLQPLGTM